MHMPLVLTNRRRRVGSASAPAFSPSSLYSSGSQGIWLDPSDLTTMFSDRAGTTPVTTPGTVVGLRLDKSRGGPGPELLSNSGGPFTATTGWSVTGGAGGSIAVVSGDLQVTSSGAGILVSSSFATVVGRTYSFSVLARNGTYTSTTIGIATSSTATPSPLVGLSSGVDTVYRLMFTATQTTTYINIRFPSVTAGTAFFNNISVRELPGNHAVAPTDAARPIYGVEPKGGRRNLLTWSEDFTNAIWTKGGVSLSAGSSAASRIVTATSANGAIYQLVSVSPSAVVCNNSIEIRRITGTGAIQLKLPGNGGNPISVTSEWVRFSASGAAGGTINYFVVEIATSGDAIEIRYPQAELGSTATNYQRTTTAYDITESGVATTHYVQYDGSDDSMSTAAIDFTATDKMSVFAGVRKLSDASVGVIADFGVGNTTGSFVLYNQATAGYGSNSVGAVTASAQVTSGYAAPINNVLTGLGDISGDRATLRINGTQVAQSTADQGSGNYGNYPLNFGRRMPSATLPFNGRDYGIVIVGKAASAGEITDTETWLADKTSGVTL